MSATRKRSSRRHRSSSTTQEQAAEAPKQVAAYDPTPMPVWRWRTLPVFFAFSLGGFIGLEIGIIAQGSEALAFAAFSIFAVMLGLAFSRVMTRFLLSKRWMKPRPPKRK